MIISLFTFGLSWGLYAFTFYGLTLIMPQFHSSYRESTFQIAFLIGFLDAALVRAIRVMNFKIHLALLFLVAFVVNLLLIFGTSGGADTYYVTGHRAPVIAAAVLALVIIGLEFVKEKFF